MTKRIDKKQVPQVFTDWKHSVKSYYYQIYLKYTKLKIDKTYYAFLVDLPYAMDPGYIDKLKKIEKSLKNHGKIN